jgi:hypothetical protein
MAAAISGQVSGLQGQAHTRSNPTLALLEIPLYVRSPDPGRNGAPRSPSPAASAKEPAPPAAATGTSGRPSARPPSACGGNSLLTIYHALLSDPEAAYADLGTDFYDRRANIRRQARNHVRGLELLGYKVTVEPIDSATGELQAADN